MKHLLTGLLLLSAAAAHSQTDTFVLKYRLKETTLNSTHIAYLNKLLRQNKIKPGQKLSIQGYADYRGTNEHNDTVSAERAVNVKNYLVTKGITDADITACAGKGEIDRPGMTGKYGNAADRKVLIITEPAAAVKKDMRELKVNEAVALNNISFQPGMAVMLQESMPELENLYTFMSENKTVKIRIEGHVCCKGMYTVSDLATGDDMSLSEQRAQAVFDYLISKGIDRSRMTYRGLGTNQPKVYPARTAEEQQQNRRVEIRIISK